MINNPLVSIIIPVYNGQNYIREAIESAISQTYKNIEIIIVNDGSTDDTEKIVESYKDNRIRYFYKPNGGVSSALNFGITVMNGAFFSWLSHDDMYLPNKVELQVNALKTANVTNAIVLCNTLQINSTGKIIKKQRKNRLLAHQSLNHWDTSLKALINNGSFYGCSLLIPKEALVSAGLFNEELRYCQDFLMWSKILLKEYSIVYCQDYCTMNRVHNQQLTQLGKSLFQSDTFKMTQYLYEPLKDKTSKEHNFVVYYANYCAKYHCKDSVKYLLNVGKKDQVIGLLDLCKIKLISIYGSIRPLFRKIYYYLFKGVKTKK